MRRIEEKQCYWFNIFILQEYTLIYSFHREIYYEWYGTQFNPLKFSNKKNYVWYTIKV